MPTRNVNLTEHFDTFIETGIRSGRFGNASEVVREALRLLEQRESEDRAKIEWLRTAVQQGSDAIEHGDFVQVNSSEELNLVFEDLHRGVILKQQSATAKQRV